MNSLPEIQLILFFLSRLHDFDAGKILYDINAIDWDAFIELSSRHKVLPLIHKSINQNKQIPVPEAIRTRIKALYRSNLIRNFAISSKLIRILSMLDENNITCVPFKGPVLAEFVYNDLAFRQFSDIDLFISRKNAPNAILLFLDQGYDLQIDLKPNQFESYAKIKESIELRQKKMNIFIDLHWEFTGNYSIQPFELEYIKKRLIQIDFLNKKTLHLSKPDLITCLCLHGAKNIWDNFENIFCVSLLLKNLSTSDEECLCSISSEKRCKKIIALGLFLCVHFFKTELTDKMKNHFIIYPDLQQISQPIIQALTMEKRFHKSKDYRFSRFNLAIRDSIFDKIRYGLRMIFLPSFVDWNRYDFPKQLTILYFIARPIRLIMSQFKTTKKKHNNKNFS